MNNLLKIKIPDYIQEIMRLIENRNYEVYLVGGCLRDTFLNLEVQDFDLTTNASPLEIKEIFKDYKIINNNGERHNTITLYHNKNNIEITSFKRNNEEDNTIETDLAHRDFTMNALAYNLSRGLIDPFNGIKSIKEKMIRAVINPYDRFMEDPLRILRELRFSSKYNYSVCTEDKKAINEMSNLLKGIAPERIKKELEGILLGDKVKDILLEFKEVIAVFIPELISTFGFKQNSKYHSHDVYTHTAYVVAAANKDFRLKVAALLHDIGKPNCYSEKINNGDIEGHFYGHPYESRNISENILKRLKFSNEEVSEILYLIENHDIILKLNSKIIKRILAKTPNQSLELFQKLLDLKHADNRDYINIKEIPYAEIYEMAKSIIDSNNCLKVTDLKVNGMDLMKLGLHGRDVGNTLKKLLKLVIEEKVENEKEQLLGVIKSQSKYKKTT